jgi:hypothetical protein
LYLGFAYVVVEWQMPYIPICPFFVISGIPCPLCGSTRLIGQYLHGAVDAGPRNPAALAWFAFVVYVAIVHAVRMFSRVPFGAGRAERKEVPLAIRPDLSTVHRMARTPSA